MMFNPGIFSAGSSSKTYSDWLAYVAASGATERLWTTAANIPAGLYKTTAASPSGNLRGSSWGTQFRSIGSYTTTSRLIQHACATLDIWNEQVAQTRVSLFQVVDGVSPAEGYVSVNRNGYQSLSDVSTLNPRRITVHRYWYDGRAWENNPYMSGSPTPFDW